MPAETAGPSALDAFDSDVLIYSVIPGHPAGERVAALFPDQPEQAGLVGVGSTLLLPELLSKPTRHGAAQGVAELRQLLVNLDLQPVDRDIAELSVTLGGRYRLRAADAIHLATAVRFGADRFITDNRDAFPTSIAEVDVTYPDDL